MPITKSVFSAWKNSTGWRHQHHGDVCTAQPHLSLHLAKRKRKLFREMLVHGPVLLELRRFKCVLAMFTQADHPSHFLALGVMNNFGVIAGNLNGMPFTQTCEGCHCMFRNLIAPT